MLVGSGCRLGRTLYVVAEPEKTDIFECWRVSWVGSRSGGRRGFGDGSRSQKDLPACCGQGVEGVGPRGRPAGNMPTL